MLEAQRVIPKNSMPTVTVKLHLPHQRLFFNREEAQACLEQSIKLYSRLKPLLPQLQDLRKEYKNLGHVVKTGCILSVMNPVLDCLTWMLIIAVMAVLLWKLRAHLVASIITLSASVLLIVLATTFIYIMVARGSILKYLTRWSVIKLADSVERMGIPEIREETVQSVTVDEQRSVSMITQNTTFSIDRKTYEAYTSAGRPKTVYVVTNPCFLRNLFGGATDLEKTVESIASLHQSLRAGVKEGFGRG